MQDLIVPGKGDSVRAKILELFGKGCFIWEDGREKRACSIAKAKTGREFQVCLDEEPTIKNPRMITIFIGPAGREGSFGFLLDSSDKVESVMIGSLPGTGKDNKKKLNDIIDELLDSDYDGSRTKEVAQEYAPVRSGEGTVKLGKLEFKEGRPVWVETERIYSAEAKG
jgi:hypothetical protein